LAQRDNYLEQINGMSDFLANAVAEVDEAKLRQRPGEYLNPVGFIYFHILRIWDLDLNIMIQGRTPAEDAWHRGGFTELLGYSPDGKGGNGMGLGFGYTDAEVDEVPYAFEPLRTYHEQLLEETRAYLNDANDDELNRIIKFREQDTTTGARVQHTIGHSWNHIGEIRMTKSMIGYLDPTTPAR
jgi:hypothetical protein